MSESPPLLLMQLFTKQLISEGYMCVLPILEALELTEVVPERSFFCCEISAPTEPVAHKLIHATSYYI